MLLINYLAIIVFVIFIVLLLICKQKTKTYLLFVVYLFPLMDIPITPASFGGLSVFDGISFSIFFVAIRDFVSIKPGNRIYLILFYGLILILILGSILSQFINFSLANIFSVFPIFIYARLLIGECSKNLQFEKKFIASLRYMAVFSIIFLIVQVFVGLNFTFYPELNPNTEDPNGYRYPAFFHDPQKYAQFLAMVSFLFLLNSRQVKKTSLFNIGSFIVIILAMLFTGGRSGFLGLSFGFVLLFIFLSARAKVIILACALIGAFSISFFLNEFITFKRNQDFGSDYAFRASIWEDAYNIYSDHPLGIGIGNYQSFVKYYSSDQYFILNDNEILYFDQPENGYLKILVEYGIIGFIIVLLLILIPVLRSVIAYIMGYQNRRIFFYIASILSFLISFVSVYTLSDKRILIVFVSLICFLISFTNRSRYKYVG